MFEKSAVKIYLLKSPLLNVFYIKNRNYTKSILKRATSLQSSYLVNFSMNVRKTSRLLSLHVKRFVSLSIFFSKELPKYERWKRNEWTRPNCFSNIWISLRESYANEDTCCCLTCKSKYTTVAASDFCKYTFTMNFVKIVMVKKKKPR